MLDSSTPFRPPESAIFIPSSSPFTKEQRIGALLVLTSEIALPLLLLAIGWLGGGDIMTGIEAHKWWIGWLQLLTLGVGTWLLTVMPERAVMYLLRLPFVALILANVALMSGFSQRGLQVQGLANVAVVAALALTFRRLRMHRFANLSLASIVMFIGVEIVTRRAPALFVDRMGLFSALMLVMHGARIVGLARMVLGR